MAEGQPALEESEWTFIKTCNKEDFLYFSFTHLVSNFVFNFSQISSTCKILEAVVMEKIFFVFFDDHSPSVFNPSRCCTGAVAW